jgi:hypothetical protein
MTHPRAGLELSAATGVPVAVKKGFAFMVILVCLGVQTYAIIRPSGARWYPFLAYPMYSSSHPPGVTYKVQELWARTCDNRPRSWQLTSNALGYEDEHFLVGLNVTAGDRPAARSYRALLSELALSRVTPRPCVLEVRQRSIPTTRTGIKVTDLRRPQRTLLWEWRADDPSVVDVLRAQPETVR